MKIASMQRKRALDSFRQRLARERDRLLGTVMTTDEELATLESHQPGGPVEDVVTEVVAQTLSRLEGQEKHELDEIDAALARLEAGVFGVCEVCGQPIPPDRLRAVPTARYCLRCQILREPAREER